MLHPDAARVLTLLSWIGSETRVAEPPLRRQTLRRFSLMASEIPAAAVDVVDLIYRNDSAAEGRAASLALRLYAPRDAGLGPALILYVHGGGWVAGDLDSCEGVCRALAISSGFRVLALDYRRAPEQPFPAAVFDIVDTLAWLGRAPGVPGLHVDPRKLILVGDSAGGNLCAAATHLLTDEGGPTPRLLVLLCPILDLTASHGSRMDMAEGYFIDKAQLMQDMAHYLPNPGDRRSPLASPGLISDLSRFPPTHLHLAQYDPFRDEGWAFSRALSGAGMEVRTTEHPGMIHYFYGLTRLIPSARAIIADIGRGIAGALA